VEQEEFASGPLNPRDRLDRGPGGGRRVQDLRDARLGRFIAFGLAQNLRLGDASVATCLAQPEIDRQTLDRLSDNHAIRSHLPPRCPAGDFRHVRTMMIGVRATVRVRWSLARRAQALDARPPASGVGLLGAEWQRRNAAKRARMRSGAVTVAASIPTTCGNVVHQRSCHTDRSVRMEGITQTRSSPIRPGEGKLYLALGAGCGVAAGARVRPG
jgi:hypothetical protein